MNKYLKNLLPFYQKLGVSLIPNDYEEPVPDLAALQGFDWKKEYQLPGLDLRPTAQVKLFHRLSRYFPEFKALPARKQKGPDVEEYYHSNPAFRDLDAAVYYGLVRDLKPKRIIEIGAGFSTLLAAQAVLKNRGEGRDCKLTAIEPYPSKTLRAGVPGLGRLLESELQKVSLKEFESLGKNDILFIDSSHVLRIASDVQYEFLEIVPRLKKGVLVHVHDIYFPLEYPEKVIMKDHKFYNEQYLLQAFLAFNREFEVTWAAQYMDLKHPGLVRKPFEDLVKERQRTGALWKTLSFWMRRK